MGFGQKILHHCGDRRLLRTGRCGIWKRGRLWRRDWGIVLEFRYLDFAAIQFDLFPVVLDQLTEIKEWPPKWFIGWAMCHTDGPLI
jgi:hypothetical protein